MGFGKDLSKILDSRNITIYQLSKATGVPATTIHAIIKRDSNNVNIDTLTKISNYLGVSLDELLLWNQVKLTINEELARLDIVTRQYIQLLENNGYSIVLGNDEVQITDKKKVTYTVGRKEFMAMLQYCHKDIENNMEKLLRNYNK